MIQRIKVSIIIPVYLVERYLAECVESVLKQNYKNKEIILVNDGSTDTCPELCNQYAKQYSNIKVIHKENGGLSDARNVGMKNATGDYIIFLDGDDFWDDSNALLRLVERLEKTDADVLNFSFKKYIEETKEKKPYFSDVNEMPVNLHKKREQMEFLLTNNLYISSACNKIIKRKLLSECLRFERGVYSEDVEWSALLLKEAKTMDFICENFYCYRQRKDSISHSINDKKSEDLCNHIIKCINLSRTVSEEERDILANYAAYQYGTYVVVQAQAENPQNECIVKLEEYCDILSYHYRNKKLFGLYIGCRIFGYKNLCRVVRSIYKIKRMVVKKR